MAIYGELVAWTAAILAINYALLGVIAHAMFSEPAPDVRPVSAGNPVEMMYVPLDEMPTRKGG